MNIKQLKAQIKNLPDEMPVGLLDLTTDDPLDSNYPVSKDTIHIGDYVDFHDNENVIKGKMLFFTFENSLNENPI